MGFFKTSVAFLCIAIAVSSVLSSEKCERSRTAWYKARNLHRGSGMGDFDLQAIAKMEDKRLFKKLLNPILIPRIPDTPTHAQVQTHIGDTMKNLGWTVEFDSFQDATPYGQKTFTNIIATLDPDAKRHLVLACHYDSKYFSNFDFIGATDSAVPCAMMLSLATLMKEQLDKHKLKRSDLTLKLIFLDGEEAFYRWTSTDSLYGARNLAKKLDKTPYPANNRENTVELHRMDLFVLLDLIGTRGINFYSYFKNTHGWYRRLVSYERRLEQLNLLENRSPMFMDAKRYHLGIQDDHIPFLHRGVPILHLIPSPFPEVWHERTDNEAALDYPSIYNLNAILRAFVYDYLHLVM